MKNMRADSSCLLPVLLLLVQAVWVTEPQGLPDPVPTVRINCEQQDIARWEADNVHRHRHRSRQLGSGDSDAEQHETAVEQPALVLERCSLGEIAEWLDVLLLDRRDEVFSILWLVGVKGIGGAQETAVNGDRRPPSTTCENKAAARTITVLGVSGQLPTHGLARLAASQWLQCTNMTRVELAGLVGGWTQLLVAGNRQESALRLSRLESINCSSGELEELAEDSLDELKHLQRLDLSSNRLVRIPNGIFRNQARLRQLHLQKNSISFISRQSFLGLRHLTDLDLSNNDIASMWLQGPVFGHLSRLERLLLAHNRITELDSGLLLDLPSLEELDLSHNQINRLSGRPFQSLVRLRRLDLSHNSVSSLDGAAFDGLSASLAALQLTDNRIKFVGRDAFARLTGLDKLDLSGNQLDHVPAQFGRAGPGEDADPTVLKSLFLNNNKIVELGDDDFVGLVDLERLELRDNQLRLIPTGAFAGLGKLTDLDLASNQIHHLTSDIFSEVNRLERLDLSENQLEDINGVLNSHVSLLQLNVSHNRLKWFDVAFFPKQLERLEVQHNKIEELSNYYKMVQGFSLRYLDASHNNISLLGPLSFVDSIEEIQLVGNAIADLGSGIFGSLASLRRVDLRNNRLKTVPRHSLKVSSFGNFTPTFYLSSNPLLCDCELEWLSEYTSTSVGGLLPTIPDYQELACTSPVGTDIQRPRPLQLAAKDTFLCEYSSHCFSLCRCCTFLACDCRMKCPDPCTCLHDQAWNKNIIQCGRRNLTRILREIPMDSTVVYLDGNSLGDLGTAERFLGRNRLSSLYLNNSKIEAVTERTFLGLRALKTLHMENNLLTELSGDIFPESTNIEELYLDNNLLYYIENVTLAGLEKLRVLTLHNNRLSTLQSLDLSRLVVVSGVMSLDLITLGKNPWECSCELTHTFQRLGQAVRSRSFGQLTCYDTDGKLATTTSGQQLTGSKSLTAADIGTEVNMLSFRTKRCRDLDVLAVSSSSTTDGISPLVVIVVCVLSGFIIISAIVVVLAIYRNSLTHWIYAKSSSMAIVPGADHLSSVGGAKPDDGRHMSTKYSPMIKMPNSASFAGGGGPTSLVKVDAQLQADDLQVAGNHYHTTVRSPTAKLSGGRQRLTAGSACNSPTNGPPSVTEYSAYLHYCLADDTYVRTVLGPKLESLDPQYRLCLHHRDLPKSCTVGQAISRAVASSGCLVILASPAYFLSSIPAYELQMILSEVLTRPHNSSSPSAGSVSSRSGGTPATYPVIVAVSAPATVSEVKSRLREMAGCQSDTWSYLDVSDIMVCNQTSGNILQMVDPMVGSEAASSTGSTKSSRLSQDKAIGSNNNNSLIATSLASHLVSGGGSNCSGGSRSSQSSGEVAPRSSLSTATTSSASSSGSSSLLLPKVVTNPLDGFEQGSGGGLGLGAQPTAGFCHHLLYDCQDQAMADHNGGQTDSIYATVMDSDTLMDDEDEDEDELCHIAASSTRTKTGPKVMPSEESEYQSVYDSTVGLGMDARFNSPAFRHQQQQQQMMLMMPSHRSGTDRPYGRRTMGHGSGGNRNHLVQPYSSTGIGDAGQQATGTLYIDRNLRLVSVQQQAAARSGGLHNNGTTAGPSSRSVTGSPSVSCRLGSPMIGGDRSGLNAGFYKSASPAASNKFRTMQ